MSDSSRTGISSFSSFPATAYANQGGHEQPRHHPTSLVQPTKVAIPRAAHHIQPASKGRVSRACENCRLQKSKCSGDHPACQRCLDTGVLCCYSDRKRERLLKQLSDLTSQVKTYRKMLSNLYYELDSPSTKYVDNTLRQLNTSRPSHHSDSAISNMRPLPSDGLQLSASSSPCTSPTSQGLSTAELDNGDAESDDADLTFVGEHSEVAWLSKLINYLDPDAATSSTRMSQSPAMSSLNYLQVASSEFSLSNNADISQWPSRQDADRLVDCFFSVVGNTFPILEKSTFLTQYRSFYSTSNFRAGKRWKTLLNIVFAIATEHIHLIGLQSQDHGEHHLYFSRAWKLSISNAELLDHTDLQQVQIEGLVTLYLLSVGQVNRAWKSVGNAIRSAMAIGLNSKPEGKSSCHQLKEHRSGVWWALFILDTTLCSMTGRSPGISDVFCTAPLPVPHGGEDVWDKRVMPLVTGQGMCNSLLFTLFFNSPTVALKGTSIKAHSAQPTLDEANQNGQVLQISTGLELPTSSYPLFFLYAVDLALLLRGTVDILYAPGGMQRPWLEIEIAVSSLNQAADDWLSRLPVELDFNSPNAPSLFCQERTSLAFRFYTTKLTILQPCLRRLSEWPANKVHLGNLCTQLAAACVQTAGHLIDLLPDEIRAVSLDGSGLRCFTLHHIMQATAVLLIELFTRTRPGTNGAANLVAKLKKPLSWLKERSSKDSTSRKAWYICTDILSRHGPIFGLSADITP